MIYLLVLNMPSCPSIPSRYHLHSNKCQRLTIRNSKKKAIKIMLGPFQFPGRYKCLCEAGSYVSTTGAIDMNAPCDDCGHLLSVHASFGNSIRMLTQVSGRTLLLSSANSDIGSRPHSSSRERRSASQPFRSYRPSNYPNTCPRQ